MHVEVRSWLLPLTLALTSAGAPGACAPPQKTASAEALGACLRTIQRATLALQVAGETLGPAEHDRASRNLDDAQARLLSAWARREGLSLTPEDFKTGTAEAIDFADGLLLEAGLGEQEKLSTLSSAADRPGSWRAQFDAALLCTNGVAP